MIDYRITPQEDGSVEAAANDPWHVPRVVVLPPGGTDGRIFHRRALRHHGDGRSEEVHWLVAELGEVRAYYDGENLILTTQDLYP